MTLVVAVAGQTSQNEYNRVSKNEIWEKIRGKLSGKSFISRPSIMLGFAMVLNGIILTMVGVELMLRMEAREANRSLILECNVDVYGHLKP